MRRLEGRRCVITGAGSGIGRASAQRFAEEGASVLVVGRRPENTEETVQSIRDAGGEAIGMVTDVTVEASVEAVVHRCLQKWGRIDVFFANIGYPGTNAKILEQTLEEWNEVWLVNVISCMLAIKHAGRPMAAQGSGSIILPATAASLRANARAVAHSA